MSRISLVIICLVFSAILIPTYAMALEDDPSELFWILIEEARWGESEAQYGVAMMYASGEGVEKDQKEASRWFKAAAEEGHPHAMHKIAERYEKGIGTDKDMESAVAWYKKAAETNAAQGDDKAYYDQLRQVQLKAMKARYEEEKLEEDRKYEDQVRREQNRHDERMHKERYRYNHYDNDYRHHHND